MPTTRNPRRPKDPNQLAYQILQEATGQAPKQEPGHESDRGEESEAAKRGRKGGQRGGKARAGAMTAKERSEAAKKAAAGRWPLKILS